MLDFVTKQENVGVHDKNQPQTRASLLQKELYYETVMVVCWKVKLLLFVIIIYQYYFTQY